MAAYAYPLLIKQILAMPAAQASRNEIVYRGELRFSYVELVARIARLGSALARLGVVQGDRVAVLDWDSHRYLECYFAVPMLGAVLMTANIRLSPEQIAYTLDHCGAKVVLLHTDFLPLIREIRDRLPKVAHFIALTEDGIAAPDFAWVGEYDALLAAADPAHEFPEFDENATATTFYTTGTTGLPKGVHFSHRQIVLHTLAAMATLMLAATNGRLSRADVYMPLTPMFHAHAWGFPFIATMAGWKQVYGGRFTPPVALALKQEEGVTFSHCVPTILHMLLNAPESAGTDLSGWKMIIGGSALPSGLCRAALARGIDVFSGYGMSETCPLLTLVQLKTPQAEPPDAAEIAVRTSAGLPAALVQLRLVDDAMRDLPHDGAAQGEVVARAPFLTQSYIGDEAASAALWEGGWLHTGDIGTIDAAGYLHVLDRKKDGIKTGGEWVSSLMLEDLLSGHPDIAEAAVIGIPDARWGERPLALVVARAGCTLDPETIRAHLEACVADGTISRYAVPDRILIVAALEKTSVGKLDKKRMRSVYGRL